MNRDYIASPNDRILVTGAAGFIGARVVEALLRDGFTNIRCFVRPSSRLDRLRGVLGNFPAGRDVELVSGDLYSLEDCKRATVDVVTVFHLAAGVDKCFEKTLRNSVLATRNLMDAFAEAGRPRRFVNVSSFSVYSNLGLKRGSLLDETSPLEDEPYRRRDAYAFGKLKQEEAVREIGSIREIPFVILRPGTVFGPGNRQLTGRLGVGRSCVFFQISGANQLPLTYVDNCAEAIVLAGTVEGVAGQAFNVVDDELLTGREFLKAYRKRVRRICIIPVPYCAAYLVCSICERLPKGLKKVARRFNRRRCSAEWKGNRYSNRKLRDQLGWSPRVPMGEAMERFLAQFEERAA